jgi:aspartyl protease family protein
MPELPQSLKLTTVWLLIGTGLFLGVQWWQARQQATRLVSDGSTVEIRRSPDGHYHWRGRVNGVAVDFLVDTGATTTALPKTLADSAGLVVGAPVTSATAGGQVTGYQSLAEVELAGGVKVHHLRVTVLPRLDAPLLGMDVLSRMRFSQAGGVLRIETAAGAPN